MGDYLIRVPAEWVKVDPDGSAWIDTDRLTGHDYRPFWKVAEVPDDATEIHVTFTRPLQPGETRDAGGGNSVHMHSGPDCACGWKLGGTGGATTYTPIKGPVR